MKFRYILFLFLIFWGQTFIFAQELTVKSFVESTNDLSARQNPRLDLNKTPCALVKVNLIVSGAHFEPNVIGEVDYKVNEYWVFLAQGTKHLKIQHPNYITLDVVFENYGIRALESNTTYSLTITTPAPTPKGQSSINTTQQYVLFEISPDFAEIELNGQALDVTDGTATKRLPFGSYEYIASAPMYHPFNGVITVDNPTNKHVVKIQLTPAFGYIDIKGNNESQDARVYIDDEYVGNLPIKNLKKKSGNHSLRITSTLYKTYSASFTIEDNKTTSISPKLEPNFSEVRITTDPGAAIWINDEYKSESEWTGNLTEGAYKIECKKNKFRSIIKNIDIVANSPKYNLTLGDLVPIQGFLDINSAPANAEVLIDGKLIGTTPLYMEHLIGNYSITIKKNGYTQITKTIEIKEDNCFSQTYKLTKSDSSISIKSQPSKAKVYIDEVYVGETPIDISCTPGGHLIEIKKEGYYYKMDKFDIPYGGNLKHTFYLEKKK